MSMLSLVEMLNEISSAKPAQEPAVLTRALQFAHRQKWLTEAGLLRGVGASQQGLGLEAVVQVLRPANVAGYLVETGAECATARANGKDFDAATECLALAGVFLTLRATA